MIPILVGQLLQVGTGTLSLSAFESYLALEQAPKQLAPAYPQGLYLSKVTYPFLDIAPRPGFSPAFRQATDAGWQTI